MTEQEREDERVRQARMKIAQHLGDTLQFALAAGMSNEAMLIAKMVDVVLSGQAYAMHSKLLQGK